MRDYDGSKLIWFLAGAALGAGVALLYAPYEGEHTRRLIKRNARRGREYLEDNGRELMERGRELYDRGRQLADEAAEMLEHGREIVGG